MSDDSRFNSLMVAVIVVLTVAVCLLLVSILIQRSVTADLYERIYSLPFKFPSVDLPLARFRSLGLRGI